jgi:hypothetical protein
MIRVGRIHVVAARGGVERRPRKRDGDMALAHHPAPPLLGRRAHGALDRWRGQPVARYCSAMPFGCPAIIGLSASANLLIP